MYVFNDVMNIGNELHSQNAFHSLKVETMNKSTFPFQLPNRRGTSLACNVIGWGIPFAKCTSMGALISSNWSSILLALF